MHRADPRVARAGTTGPNMILDDGGDATLLVHKGVEYEAAGAVPSADRATSSEEGQRRPGDAAPLAAADPQRWTRIAADILGVTEETTTGVHRLYQLAEAGQLLFPAINVNDSVTKSKFDNKYGIRHSLPDGINRATDVLMGGKVAFVGGYGDVGKGAAEAFRGQGARVIVSEVDPICALQAAMDGYQVPGWTSSAQADFVITTTGNKDVVSAAQMAGMKNKAVVGNIGHFDNEIDMAGLAPSPGSRREIKPQVHEWTFTADEVRAGAVDHRALRGPPAEPRQRDRAPVVRDEQLVLQPGHRPDRAVHQAAGGGRSTPAGVPAAEGAGREGRAAAPGRPRRPAHRADEGAGRVPRLDAPARTSRTTTATRSRAARPAARRAAVPRRRSPGPRVRGSFVT